MGSLHCHLPAVLLSSQILWFAQLLIASAIPVMYLLYLLWNLTSNFIVHLWSKARTLAAKMGEWFIIGCPLVSAFHFLPLSHCHELSDPRRR